MDIGLGWFCFLLQILIGAESKEDMILVTKWLTMDCAAKGAPSISQRDMVVSVLSNCVSLLRLKKTLKLDFCEANIRQIFIVSHI